MSELPEFELSSVHVVAEPRKLDAYIDENYRLRSHKDPSWVGQLVRPIALVCVLVEDDNEKLTFKVAR